MGIIAGLRCNLAGLLLGLRTPRLLVMGLARLAVILLATLAGAFLALAYHQEVLSMVWSRPESVWLVWLWYLAAWLLAALLVAASAVLGYLVAQVVFAVWVMDLMSRHTERIVTGREAPPPDMPALRWFAFLVAQEVPRAVLPVGVSLLLLIGGWLTPAGPVVALLSSLAAAVFMAWDNTDLVPARRMEPFGRRMGRLAGSLGFHIGFGLWFLVPVANLLFLAFAPVGGTLHALGASEAPHNRQRSGT